MTRNIDDMTEEARLEQRWRDIGLTAKQGDVATGPFNTGALTAFVNKRGVPWPERLVDVEPWAAKVEPMLLEAGGFYARLPEARRKDDLTRLAAWRAFGIKAGRKNGFVDMLLGFQVYITHSQAPFLSALASANGKMLKAVRNGETPQQEAIENFDELYTEKLLEAAVELREGFMLEQMRTFLETRPLDAPEDGRKRIGDGEED